MASAMSHPQNLIRKTVRMQLRTDVPDVVEKYRASHNEGFWPEMGAALAEFGAHNYCISVDEGSLSLFAYLEIEDEERWSKIAQTEICKKWWKWMTEFIVFNEDGTPKTWELKEMFFFKGNH